MVTAKKENLRLLATLPFEPELVKEGDVGDISLLDNDELLITREFNKMVDEIVKISDADHDLPVKSTEKKLSTMKKDAADGKVLVIPVSGGKLASHFGHCDQFAFIETEDGKIKGSEIRTPPPHEPGVLPRWLDEQGADVIIARGIGESAQQLLRENGIEVVIGVPVDSTESLANQYLANTLISGDNVCDH